MTQPDAPPPSPTGIETLDDAECRAILARQRLCVLATADGEQPYAIPIFYGFDGATLLLGISEGLKTRILDRNPRVCVTVAEVGPGDAWRSVLVVGRAEWVRDAEERARAIQVMMQHNRRIRGDTGATNSAGGAAASPRRHGGGRMMRVAEATITGRGKR